MKLGCVQLAAVSACVATATAAVSAAAPLEMYESSALQKRQAFDDSYEIFLRKRNGHACMMSIVFIVLFPLGAISLHLPLKGVSRRVISGVHAPVQGLGMAMMIGAMGLGIDIAKNDLHYISPVHAHVVLGLLVTSLVILLQPAFGILQHLYFKKTQKNGVFAHVHRWSGRVLILLGWVNSGLGFQLVGLHFVPTHALVRGFLIMGVLGGLWFLLVGIDGYRAHWLKREKLSAFGLGWKRGVVLRKDVVNTVKSEEESLSRELQSGLKTRQVHDVS